MKPKKKRTFVKRRQYYIKKDFQAWFIVKFVMILIVGGLLSIALILANTQGTLTSVYANSELSIQSTSLAIMPSVIFTTVVTTIMLGLVAVVLTLLVSHKIAGPIFRFENDIDRIARGDLKSRIHIRKDDQFQDLTASLNQMIEGLSLRIKSLRETCDDAIKKQIDENFKL